MAMILLKPSNIPTEGIVVEILTAAELEFPKFGTDTDTEVFVGITIKDFDGTFKINADNFVSIAKYLNTWDYTKWVGKSIRIYRESKLIRGNNILMVRVGEELKRKKK